MSHPQNYRIICLTPRNRFISDGCTQLWNFISCLFETKREIIFRWSVLSFTAPHFRTWFFSYLMSRASLETPLRPLFWDVPGRSLRGKFAVSCASKLRFPLKQRRVVLLFWPSAACWGLPQCYGFPQPQAIKRLLIKLWHNLIEPHAYSHLKHRSHQKK